LVKMWSGELFCSSWPQTTILTISASQVANFIDMSYWCLASLFILLITFFHLPSSPCPFSSVSYSSGQTSDCDQTQSFAYSGPCQSSMCTQGRWKT
jgi:hypothetical protein